MQWDRALRKTDQRQLDAQAWHITHVFPHSPAALAGLSSGWRLTKISGKPVTQDRLLNAQLNGNTPLEFQDETGQCHAWHHQHFPFGLDLSQPFDAAFRKRIAQGAMTDEDRSALIDRFRDGAVDPFADLIPCFQAALGAPQSVFVRLGLKQPAASDALPKDGHHEYFNFLALGFLAQGKLELAGQACDRADDIRAASEQRSFSMHPAAMALYCRAHIALAQGDENAAIAHAQKALSYYPDFQSLQRLVWTLTGTAPKDRSSQPVGSRFPTDYALPNSDPLNELPGAGHVLSLTTALQSLDEGQFLIVLAYGSYRSNYYGNLDLEKLAMLHAACPNLIGEVHIIAGSDYALDARHRRYAEGLAQKRGLPLTILWDEENTVMARLNGLGSPARFVLDKDGIILSTATFADERGLWQAVAQSRLKSEQNHVHH